MLPQPMSVGMTGVFMISASVTSCSDASAVMMPPPATMTGRSALTIIPRALEMALRSGRGLMTGSGETASGSCSISSFCTSRGRSMCTGPGRPDFMIWNAWRKAHGTCAASITMIDHLVTGRVIAAMSTAWKSSLCSLSRGA